MLLTAIALSALTAHQDAPPEPRNVAIVVYSGVELLDFAGPGEVFSATRADGRRAFNVYTVSDRLKPIMSQGFVRVTPTYTYDECPEPDIVVLPGGGVPMQSESLRAFLARCAEESEVVMSVCNGASLLAAMGLLDGLDVTTHRGSLDMVQMLAPTAKVLENRRFVDNGRVLTSGGVSAGIDGALYLVSRLHGEETAYAVARYMEYDWQPDELARLHAQPGVRVPENPVMKLAATLREHGVEHTRAARRTAEAAGEEIADELWINRLGYMYLGAGRAEAAVQAFELAVAEYPESANACDSLADGYEMLGSDEEALVWSERALAMLEEHEVSESRELAIREASGGRIARLRDGVGTGDYACAPCGQPCDARRYAEPGHCAQDDGGCGMELVRVRRAVTE